MACIHRANAIFIPIMYFYEPYLPFGNKIRGSFLFGFAMFCTFFTFFLSPPHLFYYTVSRSMHHFPSFLVFLKQTLIHKQSHKQIVTQTHTLHCTHDFSRLYPHTNTVDPPIHFVLIPARVYVMQYIFYSLIS